MKGKILLWVVVITFVGVSVYAADDDAERKGKGWLEKVAEKTHQETSVLSSKPASVAAQKSVAKDKLEVPLAKTGTKMAATDIKQPKQITIKEIQPRAAAAFREPKFKDMGSVTVSRNAGSFKSGTMNISTKDMQVQHMQKIMKGQVDYAVNVQQ